MQDHQKPVEENGERIGTFVRSDETELRVNLAKYNGHAFVSLRVWNRDRAGQWWPTKSGCSIRMREAADLASILRRVAENDMPPESSSGRPQKAKKGKRERRVYVPPKGHGWGTPEARQLALAAATNLPPWEGESAFK